MFLKPLLRELNSRLDRRQVRTFFGSILALLMHRHRNYGLRLSELGSYLLSPVPALAGTKRLSRLLHSERWHRKLIEWFLWEQADQQLEALQAKGEETLMVWDESILEKGESLKLEGLGRSAQQTQPG